MVLGVPDWRAAIIGADKARAYAMEGSNDTAELKGSTGNDTFNARAYDTYLGRTGFFNHHASGFDEVKGDVISGDDRAYMYGFTTNDTFWSRGGTARLHDTALSLFYNEVTGFESSLDKIIIDDILGGIQTLDVVYPIAAGDIDYVLQNNGGF